MVDLLSNKQRNEILATTLKKVNNFKKKLQKTKKKNISWENIPNHQQTRKKNLQYSKIKRCKKDRKIHKKKERVEIK